MLLVCCYQTVWTTFGSNVVLSKVNKNAAPSLQFYKKVFWLKNVGLMSLFRGKLDRIAIVFSSI